MSVSIATPTVAIITCERAIEKFSKLRMWDTEHYNGVLVYLFLTDRAVDIAADRGTHIKVDSLEVESFRRKIVTNLRAGKYDAGVVSGIPRTVTRHLAKHSPAPDNSLPELPDRPVVQ